MMSSACKFKMATRQNLDENEVMLPFYWLMLSNCFTVWPEWNWYPRKGEKGWVKRWVLRSREVSRDLAEKAMEAPFSCASPIPSQGALTCKGGGAAVGRGREVGRRSKKAGGYGQVTIIVANLTVGPDGCGGQAIYVRCRGASQEKAPSDQGRQSPPEGIPLGW